MRTDKYDSVTVYVDDVPVTVTGVIYYPPVAETRIDPPESSFVEWDSAFIGGANATEFFSRRATGELLTDALLQHLEN
jgi:hypothetical protein